MITLIKCGSKAVGGDTSTVTITFSSDAENETAPVAFPTGYTVVVVGVPDWATSVRISTAPTATAVTFTFGTATGTSGGIVDWIAIGYKLT